jgi:hypothetical protein
MSGYRHDRPTGPTRRRSPSPQAPPVRHLRTPPELPSTAELLLWGLYFSTLDSLIYFDGETPELHRAYTPERLLEFYQRFADAHLEWFDND